MGSKKIRAAVEHHVQALASTRGSFWVNALQQLFKYYGNGQPYIVDDVYILILPTYVWIVG